MKPEDLLDYTTPDELQDRFARLMEQLAALDRAQYSFALHGSDIPALLAGVDRLRADFRRVDSKLQALYRRSAEACAILSGPGGVVYVDQLTRYAREMVDASLTNRAIVQDLAAWFGAEGAQRVPAELWSHLAVFEAICSRAVASQAAALARSRGMERSTEGAKV